MACGAGGGAGREAGRARSGAYAGRGGGSRGSKHFRSRVRGGGLSPFPPSQPPPPAAALPLAPSAPAPGPEPSRPSPPESGHSGCFHARAPIASGSRPLSGGFWNPPAYGGFVAVEASLGGGWGERVDSFLLHVDSSPRVGRRAPLHGGRHLRASANSCNQQNTFQCLCN